MRFQMKVLVNKKFGGWGLSEKLMIEFYQSLGYTLIYHENGIFLSPDLAEMIGLNFISQRCSGALIAFIEEWIKAGRKDDINDQFSNIMIEEVDEKRPWFIHTVFGYEIVLYADEPNNFEEIKKKLFGGAL